MAQLRRDRTCDDSLTENRRDRQSAAAAASSGSSFKLNLSAPEFVPAVVHAPVQVPIGGYFYPCFQYVDGTTSGSWMYVAADQKVAIPAVAQSKPAVKAEPAPTSPSLTPPAHPQQQQPSQPQQNQAKDIILTDEIRAKIIKQAEYMFSDMNLLANETLMKHVNKDPEGFVSINFVSTLKKLKSLNVTNQVVAQALLSSTKLVVSNGGKKVRRKLPFTDKEKEELQLRTVIAENLPDDHSHQKIEKMFNVAGRVKAIRICQAQEHNSPRITKGDVIVSNRVHALVEYENPEIAEKAAEKLNDEGNWREGMRVRIMLKRSPKYMTKNRKSDSEVDAEGLTHQLHEDTSEDTSRVNSSEASDGDEDNAPRQMRSWSKNCEKSKHRPQLQTARSLPTTSTHSTTTCIGQPAKGPQMPNGTRGFTMGRGKPLGVQEQSS